MDNGFIPPNVFSNDTGTERPEKRQRIDGKPDAVPKSDPPPAQQDKQGSSTAPEFPSKKRVDVDPLSHFRGMFRLLDLISEQGSGGTVDKIIIDQSSLSTFINTVHPGAYQSLTKVDFKVLDNFSIKPVGIYGSRKEILAFLVSIGVVENDIGRSYIKKDREEGLRSGLYLVVPEDKSAISYMVYWPEETTWKDNAFGTVRRNRVTFMRYMTKIADQITCLISSEEATTLVWKQDADEDIAMDLEDDSFDRLYTFEVAKTNEQEENVTMRPGFEVKSKALKLPGPDEIPPDANVDPNVFAPQMLNGETCQAFTTVAYQQPTKKTRHICNETHYPMQLRSLVETGSISLSVDVDEETAQVLAANGLHKRYAPAITAWRERKTQIGKEAQAWNTTGMQNVENVVEQEADTQAMMREALVQKVLQEFPTLHRSQLLPPGPDQRDDAVTSRLESFLNMHSSFQQTLTSVTLTKITNYRFTSLKRRIVGTENFLDKHPSLTEEDRDELMTIVLSPESLEKQQPKSTGLIKGFISKLWNSASSSHALAREFSAASEAVSVPQFISSLDEYLSVESRLQDFISEAMEIALTHFREAIAKQTKLLTAKAMKTAMDACRSQVTREVESRKKAAERESRAQLVSDMEAINGDTSCLLHITSVRERNVWSSTAKSYTVNGMMTSKTEPLLVYHVHVFQLSQQDRHSLQSNPSFIPSPHLNDRLNCSFSVLTQQRVLYFHMVDMNRFLLILDDGHGSIAVYLEQAQTLEAAVKNNRWKKVIHEDKIGKDLLFAYDEKKRLLLVCASTKLQLHLFCFDEHYGTLQGWGSAVNLLHWYPNGASIQHACFVCGNEEIFLVDSNQDGRIFSLIAQQFRPATLSLDRLPASVHPSPDGAAVFLTQIDEEAREMLVHAYHWSTFGSSPPITCRVPFLGSSRPLLSSVASRSSIHLLGIDLDAQAIRSCAFDITTKVTEFQFREQNSPQISQQEHRTVHNCLIDCYADVWTRFPVAAAVQHHISGIPNCRFAKQLVFATDRDYPSFARHFATLVQEFEQTTRKPTENVLQSIIVKAFPKDHIVSTLLKLDISRFLLGEWLVSFLCLIPIHIAVTRENRFLPLKDGVVSPEWEKSLLGAEVGGIVDSISLGWYESIFQSYMVHKPVKVVSSMGEQSVGKSYSLNHLVDSSFAGSAMRTTEGVWLSCTPTDDALIVALDFEGVHSIERSAQEDMLLVLFNAAISNLVLFRNNFALSRDITGLFQSFQSSSTVLDPAANPSLFQSTLVIIIKDVVDSDKAEIVKEFSLKFQRIVQEEQDANFISRLHAGRLNIVPWPVIESKNFYTLFQALRKRLSQQVVTHPSAGQFLLTAKTLMAKLKANDWGSISQTLVAYRAQRLRFMLPTAMMHGLSEVLPQEEPLKNLDTNEVIDDALDESNPLYLWLDCPEAPLSRESALTQLCRTWAMFEKRDDTVEAEWINGLSKYLRDIVQNRVRIVRSWVTINLSRFTASHASITELWREVDKLEVDLKANVELCRMTCASCNLLCMTNRRHDADASHDCGTSHKCPRPCDYASDHDGESRSCGYAAGHIGPHICAVDTHLCGHACNLQDKRGCMLECTKVVGHDGEHMCPSKSHFCGEPCSLRDIKISLGRGKTHSCPDQCTVPCGEDHDVHVCESRACPMTCELCKRLCAYPDHLHGLDPNAIHLCGQEHSCSAVCSAPGSCEIETAPQSIKATFTGQHETFEYTKYSQVAKRLQCAIVIPPGERSHLGAHIHTTDPVPFHFCEARCEFCGYYCTLPLGHTQQLHETSHGSMSRSQWAIDGPRGSVLEVDGHRFGAEDDGAPMMCNLVCANLGRHAHLDYCRTSDGQPCTGSDIQHIDDNVRFNPNPERRKDWITHSLFWRRSGFKDPYSRDDQTNFAKCDAMCPGPEHQGNATTHAQPSYCTLPHFHAPQTSNQNIGLGYLSRDGHVFACKNPAVLQQAFHVIFVVDRSGSMASSDRRPLPNTPVTTSIQRVANNRLGAVYSALHAFWTSRHATLQNAGQGNANRRDSYSVVLFQSTAQTVIANDFTSDPAALLNRVLSYSAGGGTSFSNALNSAKTLMQQFWSSERTPVVIFLSDGEDGVPENGVQDLCRAAVALGKPLSLQTVAFGTYHGSPILRHMANIALDIQNNATTDPTATRVDSSFSEALDSVRLANTFLGFAESLRNPRGALMQS